MKSIYSITAGLLQGVASTHGSEKMQVNPRKTLFRFSFVLLFFLTFCIGSAWGDSWTWSAISTDAEMFATRTSGRIFLNGMPWSFTRTNATSTTGNTANVQYGSSSNPDNVVLYTNAIGGTITQIDVKCSSYGGNHTCKIDVGGSTVLTTTTTSGTTPAVSTTGEISKTGTIKITFTGNASARALYVESITVTYTSGTFDVEWYVGDALSKSETGVSTGTPPSVADDALGGDCSSIKFLGWSETNVGGMPTSAPSDLFTSNEVPPLSGNKTYYAVFGEVETNTDDSVLIQVLHYDTWSYSGTTANKTTYRLFANGAYVESDAFDVSRVAKVSVGARYFGGSSYGAFSITDSDGNSWNTGSATDDSEKQCIIRSGSSLTGYKALRVVASNGNGSTNGLGLYKIRIYVFPLIYSNCISTCCSNIVNLADNSPSGGTIEFSAASVSTCTSSEANRQATMTITPASGYYLEDFSWSTGSGTVTPSVSPSISTTTDNDEEQVVTLTFTQNVSGTSTANATFTAKDVSGWTWKQQMSDDSEIAIPEIICLYVGQQAKFVLKEYVPSDLIADKKGYTAAYTSADLSQDNKGGDYYVTRAKQVTESTTLTLESSTNSSVQEIISIQIQALPSVTFTDILHDETFDVVASTIDETDKRIVHSTKKTPTHPDLSVPVSGNACELSHLHLVGWIDKTWADEHLDATHEQIVEATDYFYTPNADIDLVTENGKTFYAVWSKIE